MACASARITRIAEVGAGASVCGVFPVRLGMQVLTVRTATAVYPRPRVAITSGPLETILVDDGRDRVPSIFSGAADHATLTLHFDIARRAQNVGRHHDAELDRRTNRQVLVQIHQDAAGGNVSRLGVLLSIAALERHGELEREANRASQLTDLARAPQDETESIPK